MKFDYAKWKARAPDTRVKDVMLMGMWGGNARLTGALRLGMCPDANSTLGKYSLLVAKKDYTYATANGSNYAGLCSDGKWHHMCVKYDAANRTVDAYMDYTTQIVHLEIDQDLMTVDMNEAYYIVNGGLYFAAGDFEIDEVRLSRKLLSEQDLPHFARPQTGLILLVH